jgi:hypothetical protein|tara:strand:+ start:206 stop:454 length:249 start_codon:yes stop_codon:yes gene_type:complete
MAFKMKGFPKNGDPKKVKVKEIDGKTFLATDGVDYLTKGYDGDIAVGDSVSVKGNSIDVDALEAAMGMSEGPVGPSGPPRQN